MLWKLRLCKVIKAGGGRGQGIAVDKATEKRGKGVGKKKIDRSEKKKEKRERGKSINPILWYLY